MSQNGPFSPTHCFFTLSMGFADVFGRRSYPKRPKNAFLGPRSYSKGPHHALEKVLKNKTPCMCEGRGLHSAGTIRSVEASTTCVIGRSLVTHKNQNASSSASIQNGADHLRTTRPILTPPIHRVSRQSPHTSSHGTAPSPHRAVASVAFTPPSLREQRATPHALTSRSYAWISEEGGGRKKQRAKIKEQRESRSENGGTGQKNTAEAQNPECAVSHEQETKSRRQ